MRKGLQGALPLQEGMTKAVEAIKNPAADDIDSSVLLAEEKALLKRLKTIALGLLGASVQKFERKLPSEQEIMLAVADMMMQVFALEAVVLRAEKMHANVSATKQQNLEAAVKVCAYDAVEKLTQAAKKVAFFVMDEAEIDAFVDGIQKLGRYSVVGLLDAKRALANAALENEKYFF